MILRNRFIEKQCLHVIPTGIVAGMPAGTRDATMKKKLSFRIVQGGNHDRPVAENLMAKAPATTAPNQIWVGDITYIETQEGWLYLAAILDHYSRRIVGWSMGERIDTDLVLKAFHMALLHRQPTSNVLFHSDRGIQYASADYRRALTRADLTPSMSRKGNCYDNATMENFWSTLKLELIYRRKFQTRAEARQQIFDYVESFYNRQRAHSALNYLSPVDFETQNN